MTDITLKTGQTINPGQKLTGSGGYLTLQTDGNLVLYDQKNIPRWASNSHPTVVDTMRNLVMQPDGNLVIYVNDAIDEKTPLWSSNTSGNPGAYMSVIWDGYYIQINDKNGQVIWKSKTDKQLKEQEQAAAVPKGKAQGLLLPGAAMAMGEIVHGRNGYYTLQTDGNFVIYDSANKSKWALNSDPYQGPTYHLQMGTDGNFVLSDTDFGHVYWTSNTPGNPGAYFMVDWDKYLPLIVQPDGRCLWNVAIEKIITDANEAKTKIQNDADNKITQITAAANQQQSAVDQKTSQAIAQERQKICKPN